MSGPVPTDTPWDEIDLSTHSLTGWPHRAECPHCAGELCLLVATHDHASYECRGSLPHPPRSAYSADRCQAAGRTVQRFDRAQAPTGDRVEPCPYCEAGEVIVAPDTHDGVCPECDALVTFDPE